MVVLHAGPDTIATNTRWMPIGWSHPRIQRELAAFLTAPPAADFVAWQADAAPSIVGGVLLAASVWAAFVVLRGG